MRSIMKLEKKTLLPLVVGASVFTLGFFAMSAAGAGTSPTDGSGQPRAAGPIVETAAATLAERSYQIEAPGRLQAWEELTLVAEVSGKIIYVNPKFTLGGRLQKGDVLFRINPADYVAERSRAEAAVESAEATLVQAKHANRRQQDLVKQGVVSEAAKDTAIANLAIAEAGVSQAKSQLQRATENFARTTIVAPFPTLVAQETASVDTYVAPGQALATLLDTRAGTLVAGLSPEKAAAVSRMLKAGSGRLKAVAKTNSGSVGSGVLTGYIERFAPKVDEASRSALVVAVFPDAFDPANDGRIFANDFMTLEITVQSTDTVWQIPSGTVRKGQFIWVVDNNTLQRRDVTVVRNLGDTALVTSSIPLEGAQILMTLLSEESEGLKVRTLPSSMLAAR
ncbi:MAG: hypothetical protein COB37_00380 [Kordiimonadales bacterium]|nr:MAG: hypothetical protein COB37_00380 [Kordiimonadales bacterium]